MKTTNFGARAASTERNVLLLTLIRMFAVGGAAVAPGLTAFLSTRGLDVWTVEAFFSLAMLLGIVPSGYLADVIGCKRVVQIGALLLVAGSGLYLSANSLPEFILAEVLLGAGHSFILGTDEALLHRSLTLRGRPLSFSRTWSLILAAEVITAAVNFWMGDLLAQQYEMYPFMYSFTSYVLLLGFSCLLTDLPGTEVTHLRFSELGHVLYASLIASPRLREVIGWNALFAAVLRIAFWTYPAYVVETRANISIGALLGIGCAFSAVCSCLSHRFCKGFSVGGTTQFCLLLLGGTMLALGLLVGPWSFMLVFVQQALRGGSRALYAGYLHDAISAEKPEVRATIASVREMVFLVIYLVLLLAARTSVNTLGLLEMLMLFGTVLLALLAVAPRGKTE